MKLFELFIDENEEMTGVNAISVVENPAIGVDFIALNDQKGAIQLAEVDKDKRILIGPALIPDRPIYRNMNGEEFYIYFSKETVAKASEMFFKNHNQQNATLEHGQALAGMTVFESWIVEDEQFDKSRKYGLELPVGSWVVSMKVDDENLWKEYIKNNKVFGFSIEGQFANTLVKDNYSETLHHLSDQKIEKALENVKSILTEYYN